MRFNVVFGLRQKGKGKGKRGAGDASGGGKAGAGAADQKGPRNRRGGRGNGKQVAAG